MNKYSRIITQTKQSGAAQAMLYSLGLSKKQLSQPQVGIGTMWFQGNPCNSKLNVLGNFIGSNMENENLVGMRFNTIGVSDGISMGTSGMRYSLPSRELIADSIESNTTGIEADNAYLEIVSALRQSTNG